MQARCDFCEMNFDSHDGGIIKDNKTYCPECEGIMMEGMDFAHRVGSALEYTEWLKNATSRSELWILNDEMFSRFKFMKEINETE